MFGRKIRELREERGISMMALANAIGVSDTAVCKWENEVSEPKLSYIARLADFFGCSADYLVGRSDEYEGTHDRPTPGEQRLLALYRRMTAEEQELLYKTVKLWNKK